MNFEDDDMEEEDEPESSDDEAGMEQKGLIDEDNEANNFDAAGAQSSQEGPAAGTMIGDDGEIGIAEAAQAYKQNVEMEEAKQELEDLKGSDDDNEAGYGEGAQNAEGAATSQTSQAVGQKRARDPAQDQETNAMDLRKLKR